MPIPDFQTMMLPVLQLASDGKEHSIHEAVDVLARNYSLTEEEKTKLLPSGQPIFYNRVGWTRTHLKKAGLLKYPRRGYFIITGRGKEVLDRNPERINMNYLREFPEYNEFRTTSREPGETAQVENDIDKLTPEEALEEAYQKIREDLAEEVLQAVIKSSPDSLRISGRAACPDGVPGGSRRDAARAVGGSGDEGIDGIIDEDQLGLDAIYIQAKKWQEGSTVGRPEIQKFVGALQGQRAKKGIFITTTKFSDGAKVYAKNIDTKVVLIDEVRLASLMIDHNVGVSIQTTYEIKRS